MKNLFILNEEEKNRILNLHESATKRHYLNEQSLDLGQSETQPTEPITGPQSLEDTSGTIVKKGLGGDPYVYAKFGNNYYYAMASEGENPNWITAKTEKSINAIKGKIFNEKLPKVKTIKPPVKTTKQPIKQVQKKEIINPSTTTIKKDKFKLKPELNPTAVDSTRVGNGTEKMLDIKKILNSVGPSKKSSLPLHIRACWDYLMGRTEPFTSADLTREEQKFVKQVAIENPKKGFNYKIWKSIGASNLPTAMSTGSAAENERLKQSGGSGSLINSPLPGQFMYFLGEVSPSNVEVSPDKKKVTIYDNYDMNNSKINKDKILKDFALQVGKFALGDAALYSVIRQTVGLKELTGYKGYPVNLNV